MSLLIQQLNDKNKNVNIKCKLGFHKSGYRFVRGWPRVISSKQIWCRYCSRCGHILDDPSIDLF